MRLTVVGALVVGLAPVASSGCSGANCPASANPRPATASCGRISACGTKPSVMSVTEAVAFERTGRPKYALVTIRGRLVAPSPGECRDPKTGRTCLALADGNASDGGAPDGP